MCICVEVSVQLPNLSRISSVQHEKPESPSAFSEWIMEAFREYSHMDPEAQENRSAMIVAFINQVAPDIQHKLQKTDRLADKSIQELLAEA